MTEDRSEAVLVASAEPTVPVRAHIVLGFVDREEGHAALRYGATIGAQLGARLHVVHVVDKDNLPIDPDTDDFEAAILENLRESTVAVEAALRDLPGGWDFRAPHGSAVRVLHDLAEATDALMIVIGSPHRGLIGAVENLFGHSVSRGLLDHRRRALVVVPPEVVIPD